MQNVIRLLERIQKIDLEIKAMEDKEKASNEKIDRLSSEIKGEEAAIQALSAEIEEISNERRAIVEKIHESGEKIKKEESRVSEIKNARELNALTKEINAANKARKQGEQEKSVLDSKIEEKQAQFSAREAGVREKAGHLKRLAEAALENRAAWTEEAGKRRELRSELTKELPPAVLKKYEVIRSKRGGVGLSLVRDETCQGCYIHIPPQIYIVLRRGTEELLTCPHCHRILYVEAESPTEAV